MFEKIIIVIYSVLMTVNGSIAVFSYYYKMARSTSNLRSPVTGDAITTTVITPDTSSLIQNVTNPAYANGTALSWVTETFESFTAIITSTLEFLKFFTGSFIGDFLGSIGVPPILVTFIYVPLGLYTAYLVISMVSNRGR